jgi:hypothetical protein
MATIKKSTVKKTVTKKPIKKAQGGTSVKEYDTSAAPVEEYGKMKKKFDDDYYSTGKTKEERWANADKLDNTARRIRNLELENTPKLLRSTNKLLDKVTTPDRYKKGGAVKKKMRNGGSLSGLKASNKRVGPVDPKGAFTAVQKKTLAGAKGKASLTKDKQLGATKMAKCGTKMTKK